MKITMYGAPICPSCVAAKEKLGVDTRVELEFKNIIENTTLLKEFLAMRDSVTMFEEKKQEGKIGIPFFILEDGTKTFELEQLMGKIESAQMGNACSIDGTGC